MACLQTPKNCVSGKEKDPVMHMKGKNLWIRVIGSGPITQINLCSDSKQDCELRAFYRLEKRLKKSFKRLPICLVMDALFANGAVFDIARENSWTFFSSHFKMEAFEQLTMNTRGLKTCSQTANSRVELENRIKCCNIMLGRARWKIENEGFNVQKNGGYGLRHAYNQDPNGFKVFYLLMQIAHTIAQLIQHSNLLKKIFPKGFGSSANLAFALLEAIRNCSIPIAK